MKKTFICACALLTMTAAAKETTFTGTGAWDATARWSNGVPVSGDTATVSGTSTVTADGLDVAYNTLNLGKNASDNTAYRQKGGTLTSEYLTEVGAALSASTMELENVDVTLNAYRLVVGRGKNARFAMQGGTLTQNLTANNCGLLTGVWAKNGTAEIVLSNVVWNLTGGAVKLGYGSIATNRLEVVGGRIDSRAQFMLGSNAKNYQDPGIGWNEMIVRDSIWTNTQGSILVPNAGSNAARLLVSNTVFNVTPTIRPGHAAGTTGTVEFADCADVTIGGGILLVEATDSHGRLVLRNQPNAADILSKVVYKGGARSEAWVELINSPFVPDGRWLSTAVGSFYVGTNKSCKTGVVIRDATFNAPFHVAAGYGGNGHLIFSNATVNVFNGDLSGAHLDKAGSTGVVEFVDSRLCLWPEGNTEAWKSGKGAAARKFYVSNHASGWGRARFSGGVADMNSLHVPRQGYGEAVIENGADVTVGGLWVGNLTGANGILTISDTSRLHVPGRITVCNQSSSTGRVDQTGGTVVVDQTRSPMEAGSDQTAAAMSIGCAGGASGSWRISGGNLLCTNASYSINLGNVNNGSGTFELAGGMVYATRFYKASNVSGTATVIFDGGLFKVCPSTFIDLLNSTMDAKVREGGAVIDTNGGNKSVAAVMEHDCSAAKDGGLVKKGEGMLTISATPTFTGDVKVEAGTLDMSGTSFALGADAAIGGGGTLVPPPGGLTVNGAFTLDPTNAPTLTVSGPVAIGAGATITVADPSLLDKKTSYRFYTATSSSGVPELVGSRRAG
ncbi:MAG: hypothetical protein IJL17_11195 [Kiritimatiellae bacterium]|nr:hypothetical protein [Kiritimatiellia bacterium]